MHRTSFATHRVWWVPFFSLLLSAALSRPAGAQEKLPPPLPVPDGEQPAGQVSVVVVPVNTTRRIEMNSKEIIREVRNENPKVARVQSIVDDPRAVLVTGLSVGTSRLTFIDQNKKTEFLDVRVPDQSGVELEAKRGRILELVKITAPTAVVDATVTGPNTVVLTGVAPSSDSVQTILETARGAMGGSPTIQVYNAMRVGGVQQVQLEVMVALVNRSLIRQASANFTIHGNRFFITDLVGTASGAPLLSTGTFITAPFGGTVGNPRIVSELGQSPSPLAFGILGDNVSGRAFLEALKTENLAKILANPSLATLSGRPANVVSGGEVPLLTSSIGGQTVQYKPFGTFVQFLPIVEGDGKIHLEIYAELSAVDPANSLTVNSANGPTNVPGFALRRAQTALKVEDGQTVAIGGLTQSRVDASMRKIPVIGELPYIGALFSAKSYTETDEELIIIVTPRLFDPLCCTQLPKYLPGRESRTPDDFELFLEGIMEAPRGPRYVNYHPGQYQGAHMTAPNAGQIPCYGGGYLGLGCANGQCATPAAGMVNGASVGGHGLAKNGSPALVQPTGELPAASGPAAFPVAPVEPEHRATLPAPRGRE